MNKFGINIAMPVIDTNHAPDKVSPKLSKSYVMNTRKKEDHQQESQGEENSASHV